MIHLYPPYDSAPPVPGSPWEEAGLELLAAEAAALSAPPAVAAATGFIRKIPRVPAREYGSHSNRARGAQDRTRDVLNDLLERGRIAMQSDGKYDFVLDETLITDALGGTPVLEETLTVVVGSGINATASGSTLAIAVDDSVLRVQTIASGAKIVLWPESVSDPNSNPSGGVYVWVNSTGEFTARTETGIVTVMATV